MPFELNHLLVARTIVPQLRESADEAFFEVQDQGEFPVLFPGRVARSFRATFTHVFRAEEPDPVEAIGAGPLPQPAAPRGGFESQSLEIPLTLRIFTPDGAEFTGGDVTLADLRRFRDARGAPSGPWSFRLTGRSDTIPLDEGTRLTNAKGTMRIRVTETIASESAPPLINNVALAATPQSFEFDLFRVGTFVAEISQAVLLSPWRGTMKLIDPDGAIRAQTSRSKLSFNVDLPTLNQSRSAAGAVRNWKLAVSPQSSGFRPRLTATVIGAGRIRTAALRSRIDALLGDRERGSFIQIFGEDRDEEALFRLTIPDVVSAESIDMHGLLEDVLSKTPQDGDARADDIQANTVYTLGRRSNDVSITIDTGIAGEVTIPLKLEVGELKVDAIDVAIGAGVRLGAAVPAVRLTISVSGKAKVKFGPATLAEIKVPGGKIEIEIGITLSPDGTPQVVTFVPDTLFDGDIDPLAAAAVVAALPLGVLVAPFMSAAIDGKVKRDFNDPLVEGIRGAFADPTLAPSILMTIFGAHLTYKPFRIDGGDLVFDHIAPREPDPKPRPGYQGAIGRSFTQLGPNVVRFNPPLLGDTWKAGNLAKIDHVVVVMMENRSYDHVLGYRAALGDGADGLTPEMIAAIETADQEVRPPDTTAPIEGGGGGPFDVRKLKEAGFAKNALVPGLMTRLPVSVGHAFRDVQQQLSRRAPGPNGRTINSPRGFVENFAPRLKQQPGDTPHGVVAKDVLGFYDNEDLSFFGFLAEHYAYCDRYFCSHPGPTLPNRMYSLTGDLQYDRYGFPILDNNNSDNFLLSRTPTIYDLLVRKGVSFRVYEFDPSVTMLRMFARYATDTTNIVSLDAIDRPDVFSLVRLRADAANGNLPAFTVVEPALHHHPQNDDHPDADMHRGQVFLREVYEALRSSPVWEKTLLIITYDEHGGLYDHVVPPIAELLQSGIGPTTTASRGSVSPVLLAPAPPAALLAVPYGVRVPTFVVSPWTMRGKGPGITLDHCSILKTVLARFLGAEKPFLSDRVSASHSFDAFLTETRPRLDVPAPPTLKNLPPEERSAPSRNSRIITKPLSRRDMRQGPVDYHELTGRLARQLGR